MDLPPIVENISIGFDSLDEVVRGLDAARLYLGAGALVRAVAVTAVLVDDVVELVGVEIDL